MLKKIVVEGGDAETQTLEFDLAIVSLAVSRKGSVLDFLIVISRKIGLKILGIILLSALDQ